MSHHDVYIRHGITGENHVTGPVPGEHVWVAVCTCGWLGMEFPNESLAADEWVTHIRSDKTLDNSSPDGR